MPFVPAVTKALFTFMLVQCQFILFRNGYLILRRSNVGLFSLPHQECLVPGPCHDYPLTPPKSRGHDVARHSSVVLIKVRPIFSREGLNFESINR